MKRNNIIVITILLLFNVSLLSAQNGYMSTNSKSTHASAVLDLSQGNSNKAFLPPRVILSGINSNLEPNVTPEEGLIVYNQSGSLIKGYYIYQSGKWNLLATRENSVSNAIFKKSNVSSTITNVFANETNFEEFFNNTGGDVSISNSKITLEPGRYVVNIVYNVVSIAQVTNTIGSITSNSHLHMYKGRLWTGSTALGGEIIINELSTESGNKIHQFYFVFAFNITQSTSFDFQLGRSGGTYTGNVFVTDAFINIERTIL